MKAVLYARVSTKDKDQDPEVQLRALRPWVTARGWTVAGEYTDKVTGDEARRRRDPPGLSQAMQQLEQHRAKVLVIYSAERLVRSPLGILRIVARVEQMGCYVASLLDGGDHFGVAVAGVLDPDAADEIDVALAFRVPDLGVLGAHREHRMGGRDAARHRRLAAGEKVLVGGHRILLACGAAAAERRAARPRLLTAPRRRRPARHCGAPRSR